MSLFEATDGEEESSSQESRCEITQTVVDVRSDAGGLDCTWHAHTVGGVVRSDATGRCCSGVTTDAQVPPIVGSQQAGIAVKTDARGSVVKCDADGHHAATGSQASSETKASDVSRRVRASETTLSCESVGIVTRWP